VGSQFRQKLRYRQLGSSSLVIQFWEFYSIVNKQNRSVAQLWDETNFKCTFRWCVDQRLFQMWGETIEIASTIVYFYEEDELIWSFQSSGLYSFHSLCMVIQFFMVVIQKHAAYQR
jgi:hypothetical protein